MKETLEEDLKFPLIIENGLDYLNLTTKIFNNGVKWQQEKSYSEEEVEIILETLSKVIVYQGNYYRLPYYFEFEIEQVIKQFKKK